eukprot:TRINITY_DN913_c0_g1_i3.p1 TRINITY_DN913_c0_g1~~TRINITY_DN913_c0_g1_i3.p1  ORF type:complete len:256 (+),score=54.54 TRINITY_DN913_c0_g1_i3:1140-1907(+)
MADHPSSKPSSNPPKALNPSSSSSAFPAPKSQLYGASRPLYRPTANKPSRRRSPSCCFCFLLLLLSLLLIAAASAAAFWFIYRPHRPTFSVSALRVSSFSLSSTSHLSSSLNLSISATNPNHKLLLLYDPFSITVLSSGVPVATGSLPPLIQPAKSTTILKSALSSSPSQTLDSPSAASIRSDLKRKEGMPIEIRLESKAKVKIGPMKTKKVRVRVFCDGINASAPKKKKSESVADLSGLKCEVKFRVKIWKWQL